MSAEKSKVLLKKIIAQLKDNLSLLEKDILKNDIRLLYELISDLPTEKVTLTDIHSNIATQETKQQDNTIIDKIIEPPTKEPLKIKATKPNFVSDLKSIKQMIDLNKSFIFINELFGGDNTAYNSFIHTLNQYQTEEESVEFLQKQAIEKKWDTEEHVFGLINRIVEKRFEA